MSDRFCPKHPQQKMTQLFTSYACDVCDGLCDRCYDRENGSAAPLDYWTKRERDKR